LVPELFFSYHYCDTCGVLHFLKRTGSGWMTEIRDKRRNGVHTTGFTEFFFLFWFTLLHFQNGFAGEPVLLFWFFYCYWGHGDLRLDGCWVGSSTPRPLLNDVMTRHAWLYPPNFLVWESPMLEERWEDKEFRARERMWNRYLLLVLLSLFFRVFFGCFAM